MVLRQDLKQYDRELSNLYDFLVLASKRKNISDLTLYDKHKLRIVDLGLSVGLDRETVLSDIRHVLSKAFRVRR